MKVIIGVHRLHKGYWLRVNRAVLGLRLGRGAIYPELGYRYIHIGNLWFVYRGFRKGKR